MNKNRKIVMKKISLILPFLLTTLFCFGQKEHLEPAKEFNPNDSTRYGRYYSKIKEYNANFDKLLFSGFSQKPYARYTCNPAFRAEYAFSVEKINGKNYVISNKFSENYWYALVENRETSVKIITNKFEISNELYLKIGKLFEILIEQTKEKERKFETLYDGTVVEHLEIGVDGETYAFSNTDKNGEIRTGITWSPHPSNKPMLHRIIKICDALCSLENENKNSQTNILEEIEKLINDLKT